MPARPLLLLTVPLTPAARSPCSHFARCYHWTALAFVVGGWLRTLTLTVMWWALENIQLRDFIRSGRAGGER